MSTGKTTCKNAGEDCHHKEHDTCNAGHLGEHLICRGQTGVVCAAIAAIDRTGQTLTMGVLHEGEENDDQRSDQQDRTANNLDNRHGLKRSFIIIH